MSVPMPRRHLRAALCAIALSALVLAVPSRGSSADEKLPPEVRFDILTLELGKALEAGRHSEILALIERLRKTGLPVDPELGFIEARERFTLGAPVEARTALVAYLNAVGRKGKHYQDAIRLYVSIKDELAKRAAQARQKTQEAEATRLEQKRAEQARAARIEEQRKEQARSARDRAEKARLARLERARTEKRRREAARRKAHRAKVIEALAAAKSAMADREARRDRWRDRVSTLGGQGDDMIRVLARAGQGDFVLGGSFTQSDDPKRQRKAGAVPWLGRIDARGRLIWQQVLGAATKQGAVRSIAALPDGGFVIGGLRDGFRFAARTDSRGAPLTNHRGQPWLIVYGRGQGDSGGLVRLGPDGELYAIGLETSKGGTDAPSRPFVLRFSTLGKTLGRHVFELETGARLRAVTDALVLPGGDVIVAGALPPTADGGGERGVLMRLTGKGEVAWEWRLSSKGDGPEGGVRLTALARGPGGQLYAAGRDGKEMLALAFTDSGKVAWRHRISGSAEVSAGARALCGLEDWKAIAAKAGKHGATADELASIEAFACKEPRFSASATALVAREDGVVVLGVQSRDNAGTNGDIRIAALDSRGKALWDRVYGHDGFDLPTSGLATADGGVIVAGATDSVSAGGRDFLMFKIDASGTFADWANLAPPPWAAPRMAPGAGSGNDRGTRKTDGQEDGDADKKAQDGAERAISSAGTAQTDGDEATNPRAVEAPAGEPPSTTILDLFDDVFGSSEPTAPSDASVGSRSDRAQPVEDGPSPAHQGRRGVR